MKYLAILMLVGLLAACAETYRAEAQSEGAYECEEPVCLVRISVEDGVIIPDRPTMAVSREEVMLRFQIISPRYNFVDDPAKAIAFDPASNPFQHFSQTFKEDAKNMVVFDSNTAHDEKPFKYQICIKEVDSCLDPVIINK